jgi:CRP/FNR family cyclic AMP-dependent transcriptional regulator
VHAIPRIATPLCGKINSTMLASERRVQLIDADPDLAADLTPEQEARARQRVIVPTLSFSVGDEELLARRMDHRGLIGLLVLDGLLLREIEVAGTVAAELIGAGDLIHPGDVRASDLSPLNGRLRWQVLEETQVAVLDGAFSMRAAEWPQILGRIALRAVWRTHGLALNLAISHQGRIEDRLLLLFWHLAQRWGRVSAQGVRLDLPLTHKTIAKLVSAQRPTVTNALGALRERGLLVRHAARSWLLPLPIPDELEPLLARHAIREATSNGASGPAQPLGEQTRV